MKLPCEMIVSHVLPVARGSISRDLVERHHRTQSDVAKIFGLKPAIVRQFAHARGQRFAYQPVKNGNILIDVKKFEEFLKTRNA